MKKIVIILLLVVSSILGYLYYNKVYLANYVKVLDTEEEKAKIDSYYIYGNMLSLEGTVNNIDATYDKVDLVLYNGKFKSYKIDINKTVNKVDFSFDSEINKGMYLDNIEIGNYPMFLRFRYKNEESKNDKDKYIYKYYILENDTDYKKSTYYTMSKVNYKIEINSDNDYKTMMINVEDNKDSNIYDIVIDPGHGGMDGGAKTVDSNLTEADVTMKFSLSLKEELESLGYKVKLTREEDSLTKNDYFDEYNKNGRAVIPQEVHSKYLFSIHLNSSTAKSVRGLEFYTADNIDYTLIENIRDKVLENTDMVVSSNKTNRMEDGIYTHNYNDTEINAAMERYENKGYKKYKVTTNSNYLYMIRETGGFMTGAYVDNSNPDKVGVNPYYNTNVGVEAYLLEVGYCTNSTDLDIVNNNTKEYANSIAISLNDYIESLK